MQILKDPIRRNPDSASPPIDAPVLEWRDLPSPSSNLPQTALLDILRARQSRRDFSAINVDRLASLLWWSQRRTMVHEGNADLSKGPIPTAGGISSVRTVVVSRGEAPWIYDARNHRAGVLKTSQSQANEVFDDVETFMPPGDGCLLLFVAFSEYLEHYYRYPETLVLREAGVLLGVMALLSELLGLAFCPLGTQAHDWSASLLGLGKELVVPGGAALVGVRQSAFVP